MAVFLAYLKDNRIIFDGKQMEPGFLFSSIYDGPWWYRRMTELFLSLLPNGQ